MSSYVLSILIFLPLLAMLLVLLLPSSKKHWIRISALSVSLLQTLLVLWMLFNYQQHGSDLSVGADAQVFYFLEKNNWIFMDLGDFGIFKAEYLVAIDGLSFPLIAMSVFVMLIAVIASWKIEKQVKGYFALLLLLNAAIMGTFTALDMLLFYLFFEFMLLPMFFLIGIWGGKRREYASIKFFLYTLLGSIFILIVMIALYISVVEPSGDASLAGRPVHSFNILLMQDASNFDPGSILHGDYSATLSGLNIRSWAFLLLFIGFAIKLPAVPLHTWLPDAHVEAPTAISVILAAILLKIGGYGLMRIAYPVFPEAAISMSWFVALVGLISIIYGALNALASKDLKRLIAYSSVSHMGFVLLGLAALTHEGISGAIYQMFSHGLISAMLFLIAGVLYDRTQDRTISYYSGLVKAMPQFTLFVLIAFFASMGLPGFAGFIGEIMVFLGAFKSAEVYGLIPYWMAMLATLGLILGAAYYLWTLQRMFFGTYHIHQSLDAKNISDLNKREKLMFIALSVLIIFFGIMPQPLLDITSPFTEAFMKSFLPHLQLQLKP
jgi:NADH-quinone oxidoreductase subunit M